MAIGFGIKAKKNMANIWLVGFFICSAIVITVKFLYNTGTIIHHPHWFKVNYPAGLLRPVFIFMYVHFLLRDIKKIKLSHVWHFIPFIVLVVYLSPFLFQSSSYKSSILNREVVNTLGLIPSWYVYFQFSYSFVYILLIYFDLNKYSHKHSNPSKSQKGLMQWIRFLLWGGMVYLIAALVLRIAGFVEPFNYYLYEIFSILLVLLCIRLITLPEIVSANPATKRKYNNSWLSEKEIDALYSRIIQMMVEESLYKRHDLKLKHISVKLDIPEYLVSQIINQKSGQSFRVFLNAFRINKAKEMLPLAHEQYTIEGIANSVGFGSRASFYNAFKKETNLTPTEYLSARK